MKEYATEIATAIVALTGMAGSWFLGGKQASRNKTNDSLTKGADQIVDTSNKLLAKLEQISNDERERAESERTHREICEKSLSVLTEKVEYLENKIK